MSRFLDNDLNSTVDLTSGNTDINVNSISAGGLTATSGVFTGDIQCQNITVVDTLTATTIISVDQLEVKDNIIEMSKGNTADILNSGLLFEYNDGVVKYDGFLRSHNDKYIHVLANLSTKPLPADNITELPHGNLTVNKLKSIDDITIYKASDSQKPRLKLSKARTSLSNPSSVANGDFLGSIEFEGLNIGGFTQTAGDISASATEDFLVGSNGTNIILSTVDNGSFSLSQKLKCDSSGVIINGGANIFTLPSTQGTTGQVITQSATGLSTWSNPSTADQLLNTTNNVEFNALKLKNKWDITVDGTNGLLFKPIGNDVAQFDISNLGVSRSYRSVDTASGDGSLSYRSRGSLTTPTTLILNDDITFHGSAGHDGVDYRISCLQYTTATENWNSTSRGTSYRISTCDNGNTALSQKLIVDSSGVSINDGANKFTLPATQGTNKQVLTQTSTGVATWSPIFDQDLNTINDVVFARTNITNGSTYSIITGGSIIGRNYRSDNGTGGVGVVNYKSGGTITTPTAISNNTKIREIYNQGHDGTNYGNGSYIETRATEAWSSGNHGANYIIQTTDNGSATSTTKLTLDTAGVSINDAANKFTLPSTQGTDGQVIQQTSTGLTAWIDIPNPFDQLLNSANNAEFGKLEIKKFQDSAQPLLIFNKARGSISIPDPVANGDVIGDIEFQGRNSDGNTQSCGDIITSATQDFTTGANGTNMIFRTVDDTTTTLKEKLKIDSSGVFIRDLVKTGSYSNSTYPISIMERSKNNIDNPARIVSNDIMGQMQFKGYESGSVSTRGVTITSRATETFEPGANGSSLEIHTVNDTTSSLDRKLLINTNGITINRWDRSITLPTTRGTKGQLLETDGVGLATWETPPSSSQFVSLEASTSSNGTTNTALIQSGHTASTAIGNMSWASYLGGIKHIHMSGKITHTAGAVLTLQVLYGGAVFVEWPITFSATPATNAPYRVKIIILTKASNIHNITCTMVIGTPAVRTASMIFNDQITLDTTAESAHSVFVEWSDASSSIDQTLFNITSKAPPIQSYTAVNPSVQSYMTVDPSEQKHDDDFEIV